MFYDGPKPEAEKYHKRFTDIGMYEACDLVLISPHIYTGPIADMRQDMPYKDMNTILVRFTQSTKKYTLIPLE